MSKIEIIGCIDYVYEQDSRVYSPLGISPTLRARSVSLNTPSGGVMIMEIHKINIVGCMDNTKGHTFESANRVYGVDGLTPTIPTCAGGGIQPKIMEIQKVVHSAAMRGRYEQSGKTSQCLEVRTDKVSNNLTTVQKDSLALEIHPGITDVPEIFQKFIYEICGELYLIRIRKLTPLECWRLMGFSDDDYAKAASVVSNTQLYKQAGNSIVKQVLMKVFSQMLPTPNSKTAAI